MLATCPSLHYTISDLSKQAKSLTTDMIIDREEDKGFYIWIIISGHWLCESLAK